MLRSFLYALLGLSYFEDAIADAQQQIRFLRAELAEIKLRQTTLDKKFLLLDNKIEEQCGGK